MTTSSLERRKLNFSLSKMTSSHAMGTQVDESDMMHRNAHTSSAFPVNDHREASKPTLTDDAPVPPTSQPKDIAPKHEVLHLTN
mmetsp:Transcript_23937/g.29112  ORF Transcript_23937/g.29112 Transcript_23937/m.29112 type:complete len:84 (+) Transcript_23937:1692-1943(+)